jgi:hypothetical protein
MESEGLLRFYKNTPLSSVRSLTDTVHDILAYAFKIYFNIILLSTPRPSNHEQHKIFNPKCWMHFSSAPITRLPNRFVPNLYFVIVQSHTTTIHSFGLFQFIIRPYFDMYMSYLPLNSYDFGNLGIRTAHFVTSHRCHCPLLIRVSCITWRISKLLGTLSFVRVT